jgi:modulator of FtsH protease
MNPDPYNRQSGDPFSESTLVMRPVAEAPAEARLNFIRKTYMLFMAGILMSIVGGTVCLNTPLEDMVRSMGSLMMIVLLFGSVFVASALSHREGLNYVALFGFTFLMGVLFAPIIQSFELAAPGIVGQAAFLTTLVFGSLTAYAFISRKDFSYLGGMLFVGLIALIIGGLANVFFFKSSGASYWMAWVTVFLFSGFVLYDTSQIIHRYDERGYCAAALSLFLDFLNLFMAILRILGGSRR